MKKPKNYYCHKPQFFQSFPPISDNLQVVEKIGEGAFGEVFKVFDHNSSQLKVLKRHKRQSSNALFTKQNEIMKEMSGSEGFAKVKQFYSQNSKPKTNLQTLSTFRSAQLNNKPLDKLNNEDHSSQEIIMMECLGENLSKVVQRKPVTIFTMKRIAQQLILRLRQLHQKGYVHRDLKPENILLGNQTNPHKIYLVDFGLVSTYRSNPKKIRKIYDGLIGTAKYCPIASHLGYEQFPKDDLQSLGYVLIYLIKGELPWKFSHQMPEEQKFQKIFFMKLTLSVNEQKVGIFCLKKYFEYIKSLNLGQQINYNFLLQMFKTDSREEYCFEFCRQNCFSRIRRMNQGVNLQENSQDLSKIKSVKQINIRQYQFQSKFIK